MGASRTRAPLAPPRMSLSRYDAAEAQAAFTSDVYQAAFALLDGVKRDVRVIEGFE